MNKIFKYLLGVFGIFFIGINLCNAGIVDTTYNEFSLNTTYKQFDFGSGGCIYLGSNANYYYSFDGINEDGTMQRYDIKCFTGIIYLKTSTSVTLRGAYVDLTKPTCPTIDQNYCTSNNLCPSCPTCEEQYTSLECQTEYNLIPISSVTQSYCELNYNLIDPSTCPISEGTGVVNWSSLFINNTQYAGNDNIEIFIPDFIGWSIIYNSGTNYIDIEGYNADTEYIEDIIDKENMQPTNEDFAYLMQGLQVYAPYLFLFLLFAFTIWLVNKLFHHK